MQAQPKLDTIPKRNTRDLTLTKEERGLVFEATKLANPNVSNKAFLAELVFSLFLFSVVLSDMP